MKTDILLDLNPIFNGFTDSERIEAVRLICGSIKGNGIIQQIREVVNDSGFDD
jgi:hypothetical protein